MIELVLVIAGILLLSGFFSGGEAALVSLTDAEMEAMRMKQPLGWWTLNRVHTKLERAVITIVVCNNVVNIVGSILVGQMVISLYGDAVLAVITTALTFGIILFSEIIPKSLGIHNAEYISLLVAPIILLLMTAILPIILLLEQMTKYLKRGERKVGTEEQIRSLVSLGRKSGHIKNDEVQLIHRAFILNDKTAADIMTPLKDIVAVQDTMTVEQAWEKVENDHHSRYPVFGPSVHDVQGTMLKHDLLAALYEELDTVPVSDIMRDALVVEDTMPSDDLIRLFKEENKHLAVVQADEHTVGLITLEDVIEQLVGEIEDETDVED